MPGYSSPRTQSLRPRSPAGTIQNVLRGLGELRLGQKRGRRIRPHAAGVQALVALERALVILRGRENPRRRAVAQGVHRDFDALEIFLNDHLRARRAEHLAHHDFVHGLFGFGLVVADQHAFAEREPVGFHHTFAPSDALNFFAATASENVPAAAVGMPYCSMNFCEKTFDASNCAAFRFTPQIFRPCS